MKTCYAQLQVGYNKGGLILTITTRARRQQMVPEPLVTLRLTHEQVVTLLRGYGVYVAGATLWTPECDQTLHEAAQAVVQFWQLAPHAPMPTYLMTALEAALQEEAPCLPPPTA